MTSLEIQAFLTVHRTGSITKAAEQLYINQSSLSTRLRTLERELGFSLFYRKKGSHGIILTPEGSRFLPLAQQHQDLEEKMRTLKYRASQQTLRISSLNSIGNYLLPPVYERFAKLWPSIKLEIMDFTTAAARDAIIRDELDLAFSTLCVSTEQITSIPFVSEPMTFLCAAGSDYPDLVPISVLSTDNEVYSNWSSDLEQWHRVTFGANAAPKVHLELMSQIRLFTAQDEAWAVVPQSIADYLQDAPDLRKCTVDFPIPDRLLYILCRRNSLNSLPVQRFLDCLRNVLIEQEFQGLLL